VRDAASNRPIAGALVRSAERDPFAPGAGGITAARSDARGTARVVSMLARDSTISAHAVGFAPASRRGAEIRAGGAPCTIDLERGQPVLVRVIDSAGAPVAGVRVAHEEGEWSPSGADEQVLFDAEERASRTRVTDRGGRCTFADVAPGTHAFHIERDRVLRDGEWSPCVVAGNSAAEITLVTRGVGEVLGLASDGKLPLAGARIAMYRAELAPAHDPYVEADRPLPAGLDTTADSRGRFRFQNIDAGRYVFVFAVPGQNLRVAREAFIDVGTRNLAIDVARDAVDGEVRRSDGTPAAGAAIWVVTRERDTRADALRRRVSNADELHALELDMLGYPSDTSHPALFADAQGRFRLCGLAHNTACTLYASDGPESAGARTLPASRRAHDEHDIAIQLGARGTLRANIGVSPWRNPLALVATHPTALPRVVRVRPGLAITLPALEPGKWEITLRDARPDGGWIPIGDRHELEIRAGAGATLDIPFP
jgi:hypothetical protein